MSTILYIKVNAKPEGESRNFTIAANMMDVIGIDVVAIMGKAIKEAEELAKSF